MDDFNESGQIAESTASLGDDRTRCGGHEQTQSLVVISINNLQEKITAGRHSVAELKRLGHVPECDELAEVKGGQLRPLPDDGVTHIEGGEQFLSSPRSCGSS